MGSVVIINQEGVRAFAKEHGQRISVEANRNWLEQATIRHITETGEGLWRSLSLLADLEGFDVARAFTAGETIVRFSPSAKLTRDVARVANWLASSQEACPRLAVKLDEIEFSDALEFSAAKSAEFGTE
jgi:hypothetical protein